jgi:hypothetical protein
MLAYSLLRFDSGEARRHRNGYFMSMLNERMLRNLSADGSQTAEGPKADSRDRLGCRHSRARILCCDRGLKRVDYLHIHRL